MTDHPDRPADLVEGRLTDEGATTSTGHVSGCPPIGGDVLPTSRRRRGAGPAALAAVVCLALLVTAVVLGWLHSSPSAPAGGTAGAGAGARAAPRAELHETSSGRDYTAATLAAALPALLGPGQPSAAPSGSAAPALPPRATSAPTQLQPLRGRTALLACLAGLQPGEASPQPPLAVDLARWHGQPAAVIVLPKPHHADQVEAWVVGPGCSRADADVRYYASLPRPSTG